MNAATLLREMAEGATGTCRQLGMRIGSSETAIRRAMNLLDAEGSVEAFGHGKPQRGHGNPPRCWRVTELGRKRAEASR